MTAKMHGMRKPEARANVRIGAFERSLAAFADEMGRKVGVTLEAYDQERMVPFAQRGLDTAAALEALTVRVAWLETPVWLRAATRIERWWNTRLVPWMKAKVAGAKHPGAAGAILNAPETDITGANLPGDTGAKPA